MTCSTGGSTPWNARNGHPVGGGVAGGGGHPGLWPAGGGGGAGGAVWARTLVVAAALAAAILLYDGRVKGTAWGPLAMGTCRLLNVVLGLSVGRRPRGPRWR